MRNNKAAIELSMTTIVVVVLSLTLLIMGFVLVRSIMCSAIGITDTVGDKAKDRVNELFESTGGEIQCIGSTGSPVAMVPGQTNIIYCGIKAPKEATYKFDIEPKYGLKNSIEESELKLWFESMDFKQDVSPADRDAQQIARVVIPEGAPEGDMTFTVQAYRDNVLISTKTLNYKVARQGFIQSAMC
jgi:hypothetical protein